ncbi:MAG: DNA polymerase III subunit delta [Candidatus Nanopelagicales bacterium]
MTLKVVSAGEEFLAERYLLSTWKEFLNANPEAERRVVDAADENSFAELIDALSPGLFGEVFLLIVDNIELASEEIQKFFLLNWAEGERPLTVVVQRSFVKGRGFVDKLKKQYESVAFEKIKGKGFSEFIVNECKAAKRKIDAEAVTLLRNAVGDDLRLLAAALSQVLVDVEENPISASSLSVYFEGFAVVPPYQIVDHIFARKPLEALLSLRWAIESDPNIGPAIIATAMNTIRSLVAIANSPSGLTEAEIAGLASVPVWKVRTIREQLRKWRPSELADASLLLTFVDASLKAGAVDELGRILVLDPIQRIALLEKTVIEIATLSR